MMKKKLNKLDSNIITKNKAAYYEYYIDNEFEAGLVLYGWEVKSLRAGKINISDSYILIHNEEAYLSGSMFQPLAYVSNNNIINPKRDRKLLLTRSEINFLNYNKKQKGYTIIALMMYWKKAWCKLKIGIARGKKQYNKRDTIKDREWKINKERILKNSKL
ncbi:SsrA-binding protein [Candidatus Pantoea edessiphila]|uniref:SsrA-binding protein n=1 Tax=Candidatus Pantoea edessiphila TaxID=2044610 RepID=A0A2P5T118_9GAMM|nr:SsrA-binding protein SmpB [Candidatus Pantoea edessiphila]PPI88281.1 SsrA-binding protein [Candidatus Pantoea edessiphila]